MFRLLLTCPDSYWHVQTPIDIWRLILTFSDSYWHVQTHVVQAPIDMFRLILICSNLLVFQTPSDMFRLILTHSDSHWHVQTPTDMFRLLLTCSDSCRHVQTPITIFRLLLTRFPHTWKVIENLDIKVVRESHGTFFISPKSQGKRFFKCWLSWNLKKCPVFHLKMSQLSFHASSKTSHKTIVKEICI